MISIRELDLENPVDAAIIGGHEALGGIQLDPKNAVVFVAEDTETGEIKGVQCVTLVLHLEPAWTAADVRGSLTAVRLFQTATQFLDRCRVNAALCYTDQPVIMGYLERLGLKKLPYTSFLWAGKPALDESPTWLQPPHS